MVDGDVEHSMFLLLHGRVEAQVDGRTVAVEGPGSVLGEIALLLRGPRTADVIAVNDRVEVLYLRARMLEELMNDAPHLAARLLLNLSRILATKLRATYRCRDVLSADSWLQLHLSPARGLTLDQYQISQTIHRFYR